jgi:Peptidase S24-like
MPAPRDFAERMARLREIVERRVADYDARYRRRRFPLRRLQGVLRSADPRLSTVMQSADDLGTTVGDLLGEQPLGEADRQRLREFVEFLIARFDLADTHAAVERDKRAVHVSEAKFIEHDFDYPRPHHVWIVRHAKAAAGSGIEGDRDTETSEVLHSIHDVYNGQLRVIRVKGNSMEPVLHDGDKVTFDIRLVDPQAGDVVAVYDDLRGGIIGYWRPGENGEAWLDKENPASSSERLEAGGAWKLWGTVTRIVDTPVRPRRRYLR